MEREILLFIAVSCFFLDNFQDINVSQGKLRSNLGQLALLSGINGLAGLIISGDVSKSADTSCADYHDPRETDCICQDIGWYPGQWFTDYTPVKISFIGPVIEGSSLPPADF